MAHAYRVCIIVPPGYAHASCFLEVAYLLKSSLVSLGRDCDIACNTLHPDRCNIVVGYHLLDNTRGLSGVRYIPYQLEQLGEQANAFTDHARAILADACQVWDYSRHNVTVLAGCGIAAQYVPPGYHENLERISPRPENDKDIDVLFYGALNERRKRVLQALARNDVTVKTLFGVYGQQRDACIARARVVLNIHYYDTRIFEAVRMSYLFNNGCCLVSEESASDPYPKLDMPHTPYEALVDRCLYLLSRPRQRHAFRKGLYERFRTHYYMPCLMQDAVASIERDARA
jgi:hypothetical protein